MDEIRDDIIKQELKNAVKNIGSLQEICIDLVKFFFSKGRKDGFIYFKAVLAGLSFSYWAGDVNNVSEEFFELNIVSDDRINELIRTENLLISKQIQNRVSEDEFYRVLWDRLWDDILLPTKEDKEAIMFLFWGDGRVPYYQIDDIQVMDEEKYSRLLKKIIPIIKKGEFILNANIEYKSQLGSLLMGLTQKMSEDEKSIFWGVLISQLRSQINMLLNDASEQDQ